MSFVDDVNRMVDTKVKAAINPKRWLGTITSDPSDLTTTAMVVLDGSTAEIVAFRPHHILALTNTRVMVEEVNGVYIIMAEFGAALMRQPRLEMMDSTDINFTHTAYSTNAPICGVAFTAPATGRGIMHIAAHFEGVTANICSFSGNIQTGSTLGSGTDTAFVATDNYMIRSSGVAGQDMAGGVSRLVTGLTPGAQYNAVVQYKTTGGTGHVFSRVMIWDPEN